MLLCRGRMKTFGKAFSHPFSLDGISEAILPFDQNDVFAVLLEPSLSRFVVHARIVWVEMIMSQCSAHRPASFLFGLLEVFVDLVMSNVLVKFLIVDLNSESHASIGTVLGVVEVSFDPDDLGTVP